MCGGSTNSVCIAYCTLKPCFFLILASGGNAHTEKLGRGIARRSCVSFGPIMRMLRELV